MHVFYDKKVATLFAVVEVQTAAETELLAAKEKVALCNQKSRKYTGNYMLLSASNTKPDYY